MSIFRRNSQRAALVAGFVFVAGSAMAQSSSPGLLDNLFGRSESSAERNEAQAASDLQVRVEQLEARLRQATGTIEQLQYRNQQLEQELARLQGGAATAPIGVPPRVAAPAAQALPLPSTAAAPSVSGKRSDAFDPAQHPDAPGVPRALGGSAPIIPPAQAIRTAAAPMPNQMPDDAPVGAPGGRAAGAPLDLSSLSSIPGQAPSQTADAAPVANSSLPPPPPRNPSATGTQLATLPPSNTPKDEYDLAYGYVLHKDYSLAENVFVDFLRKYPKDKLAPDAHFWLGESFFQRQRYQDAADSYLVVVRNYESSDRAPDALLRLGQSLAALGQKEMACASLGEISRKYPRASAKVKGTVAAEQKRVHC